MSAPEASVVVAAHNRAERLRALLHSLAAQEGARFEAIVVDDASADATPEVLAAGVPGLDLRAIRHDEPRGPAAARNAGWRAARAPLVAFVDDDSVADPGWLEALVAAHRRAPGAVIQGRIEEDPEALARSTVYWRSLRVDGPNPYFPTCNIAYPRELLERLGGFDESYRRPYGEDTDLGWRAREAGAPTIFEGTARVTHAVYQLGVLGLVRDATRFVDIARVVKRHPQARRESHRGVFWLDTHERLMGVLAGLVLAGRTRGASMLLATPYALLYRRFHRHWRGTLAALPGYAAIDLAQVLALLRGSVRYRTFVL